jgi:hypothetical protein
VRVGTAKKPAEGDRRHRKRVAQSTISTRAVQGFQTLAHAAGVDVGLEAFAGRRLACALLGFDPSRGLAERRFSSNGTRLDGFLPTRMR